MTHPFEKFTSAYHERAAAHAEIEYEQTRVAYTLKALHFHKTRIQHLMRKEKETTNFDRLTFDTFNREYPSFPLLLGASTLNGVKMHLDKRAMLPSLFRQFNEAPFVEAFEAFYESTVDHAQGRTIGLVFPRKGIRHGLIVYSGDFDIAIPHSLMLVYTGGTKKKVFHLYVRSFQQMIEAIRCGWKPGED